MKQPAAIFDLDGTLLPLPSLERRFLAWLRWRKGFSTRTATRWLAQFAAELPRGLTHALYTNKFHLAGFPASLFDDFAASLTRYSVPFFPAAVRRLEWHAAAGHRVILITGTLAPLARAVASQLPVPVSLFATELESHNTILTGRILSGPFIGKTKARLLSRLARDLSLDLSVSFAYADRFSDRHLLSLAAYPAAVNPDFCLACLARGSGWTILDWRETASRTTAPSAGGVAALHTQWNSR